MSKDQIREEALALSEEERELLAEELWLSVHSTSSEEIEKAWIAEAEKRMEDVRNGTEILHDGPQVMKELREKYSR
jgi:putative addiction module component (TIGR02574 family)